MLSAVTPLLKSISNWFYNTISPDRNLNAFAIFTQCWWQVEPLNWRLLLKQSTCYTTIAGLYLDWLFLGDTRVNEQIMLIAVQIIWAREHNRLAEELQELNPHWSDETLYQVPELLNFFLSQFRNKLECLSLWGLPSIMQSLLLKQEAHSRTEHMKCSTLVDCGLIRKHQTRLERLPVKKAHAYLTNS
jgi:hypothetical protein